MWLHWDTQEEYAQPLLESTVHIASYTKTNDAYILVYF